MPGKGYMVVLVTVADAAAGLALGRRLVDEGLVGCVQVLPGGTAVYRWQGQTYEEPMTQLLLKTRSAAWPALLARIRELHTDEVPEILAMTVEDGLPAYLAWMDQVVNA